MEKVLTLVFAVLSYPAFTFCQDTAKFERKPYTLKVLVDKKAFYEENLKSSPYVHPDNTLQIYPGETVYIEAKVENDSIVQMTAVPEIKDPSKTIVISFTQHAKKKVHEMMMLKVNNPFSANLSYEAMIYLMQHKKWVKTSILPVHPGLAGYETWPDIITSIALGNWRLEKN